MNKRVCTLWALVIFLLYIAGGVSVNAETIKQAYFAGGCFWCMESTFEHTDGVQEVISGYAGGKKKDPTYKDISSGRTEYYESVKIIYDAEKVDYNTLLNIFWRHIDPTDGGGQFIDRGKQYRTAIFYENEDQQKIALKSKKRLEDSNWFSRPIVTEIVPFTTFYKAELHHQDYYKKNPYRYEFYRKGSGRDTFWKKVWGKDANDIDEIQKKKS